MDENNGTRIVWSTRGDGGKTWAPQQKINGVATSASPALASDSVGTVYMVWKGANPDTTVWWPKCNDGKKWTTQQRGPVGAIVGPAAAVDGNKTLWVALTAIGVGQNTIFPVFVPGTAVYFSCLSNESANQWSPRAQQDLADSQHRPALIPTGNDSSFLMLAWCATGGGGVTYSRLLLPAQTINFLMTGFFVKNTRPGHFGRKDGSDTDYVVMAAKVSGQPAKINIHGVDDVSGGAVNAGVGVGTFTISPGDILYFHYGIINSSAGTPTATTYLENVANGLLNACEKADEAAIQSITGLPLTQLGPQEAGALIGAQVGTNLPGVGTILGAIAGWLADNVWSFGFPDCDGPVAAGLYILDAETIRRARRAVRTFAPTITQA